ncbi:MAG: 3'(2'),5'-bisphosphate nucleotidase CysQ [Planctomycetes bacterium]|nr:3'(2'),5'-bisphosphate nucleotidase CysQ [Planctomycetota bacterium]MCB9885892.1 3'(2'),5'-bisphosphate nucleotidase CysQ [Planctomycetota bacterium]
MTLTDPDLAARLSFAAQIAAEAGRRLFALRASGRWTDEKVLGDVGDQAADGYLQGYVRGRYPLDALLSEETKDSAARLGVDNCWIVDPLDGTKEYRSGRHDWAVHVGFAVGGAPALGAVALPAIYRVLAGCCVPGQEHVALTGSGGDWPDRLAAAAGGDGPLRLAVSRSHTPDWVQEFARQLGGAEFVPSGSVGFKVALLLLGKADAYVHKPGLKEWDTCAPEAIARAAGWAVCRIDGSAQRYNQANPRNDEIVVCRPAIRARVLEVLAGCAPR